MCSLLKQLSSETGSAATGCASKVRLTREWLEWRFEGVSEIYWLEIEPPVTMAIVSCPRAESLKSDLIEVRAGGIDTVVSLLEPDEAEWLGLGDERRLAEEAGLKFISFPIPDANVPLDPKKFRKLIADLAHRVTEGEIIGVHCRGCIGRSTVTAACILIQMGYSSDAALAGIEAGRGCAVPDTREQERWILHYKALR
jgi:protein-tyrosine phosphatase